MRFAAFVLACVPAIAAGARVNIDQLIEAALRNNPEALAARSRYEASRQRPAQARSLPDPMVSFGWNANGNPLPGAGLGTEPTSNIGGMVSQEIPYPGKLRLKAQLAAREADAEAQQYRATQLNVISRLKQAFSRLQHSYAMKAVLERNRESLRMLLRVAEGRYSVGKTAQADVFRVQMQITLIETRLVQIDRERRAREAEIQSLVGSRDRNLGEPEEPHMHPLDFTLEELKTKAAGAAPMLARDQKMIERGQSALSLAREDSKPDVTLNAGYYSMGSMPAMYMFRADLKLPVFRSSRNHADVAERSRDLAASRHAYEATARSLEYRIEDDYIAAETAQKLLELYEKTVIPQGRMTIESSLASYQAGTLDLMSVLNNQIAVFEYEMNYHEQMQEFHLALARLEEMTGVEIKQ